MTERLDGNALAGPLADTLQLDPTVAVGLCAGCGESHPLATLIVYSSEMGSVGHCVACGNVLLVLVRTPAGTLLNIRGLSSLCFTQPGSPPLAP